MTYRVHSFDKAVLKPDECVRRKMLCSQAVPAKGKDHQRSRKAVAALFFIAVEKQISITITWSSVWRLSIACLAGRTAIWLGWAKAVCTCRRSANNKRRYGMGHVCVEFGHIDLTDIAYFYWNENPRFRNQDLLCWAYFHL